MRALLLVLLCGAAGCRSKAVEPVASAPTAVEAEPPPDVGNADDLYQRAMTLKDEHPGEAIRLYKKASELSPTDARFQANVKEQLAPFERASRDRGREAYLFGWDLRESSPDDAALNFEQAMNALPRGDPIYEKAKVQLAKIRAKSVPKPKR